MNTRGKLDRMVLVLNAGWRPISTTTVRTAFALLCRGVAMVVCPDTCETFALDRWAQATRARAGERVRTPGSAFLLPEVVVLSAYDGVPWGQVTFTRRNLYRRDLHACQYCGSATGPKNRTIDHVHPRSRGGRTTWENCVTACLACNAKKADRTPAEAGMRLSRRPARPRWSPVADVDPGADLASWERFLQAS